MRILHTTILLVAATACAAPSGPPEIVVDRSACDRCGMLISELRFAGAYRLPEGEPRVFDDLGCLRAALAEETDATMVWVRDSVGDGWLDADSAWFVRSPEIPSPMGSGFRGLRDEESARRLVAQLDEAELLDFSSFRRGADAEVEHDGGRR